MRTSWIHAVDDNVLTHGGAARPSAEIFIAGSSSIGEAGQKSETAGDYVNQAGRNIHAAALFGGVKPTSFKIGFGLWRYPVRHQRAPANSAIRRARPRSRTSAANSRMDSSCSDGAAFTAGEGSAGLIEGRKKLYPPALAFFPQRQRFPYRLFLAVQSPGFNSAAGERFLVRRKLSFHCRELLLSWYPKGAAKDGARFVGAEVERFVRIRSERIR